MLVFFGTVRESVFLPKWKWSEGYVYVIGLGLSKG